MAGLIRFLRSAPWLTGSRLRGYAVILVLAWAAALAWTLAGGGRHDPAGKPVGTDFLSFYSVSSLVLEGRAEDAYRPPVLAGRERAVAGDPAAPFYAWAYPPIALLLVAPLALLGYLPALGLWLVVGGALYAATLWRIRPGSLTLLLGFAFPAVFLTLGHGQNALLTTAILGAALVALDRRPWLAGLLIACLTFKPQLGLLLPVALLAGRHGRALAAAVIGTLLLAGATLAIFGPGVWTAFFARAPLTRAMLEQGLVDPAKLQSVFAAVRLPGGGIAAAYALQALVAAGAGAATIWAWARPAPGDLRKAALVTAGLLASPFLLDYDLALLALPLAWLARRFETEGAPPWAVSVLAACFLLPLAARPLAQATGLVIAPLVLAFLLALTLAGIRAARRPAVVPPGPVSRPAGR